MPLVSVIITNYNGKRYLEACIDSLKSGSFSDFQIIIADNGSADGSIDFIRQRYPEIKVLDLKKNLGLSVASNRAKELASGKYLFFYNNDTIADKNMLRELVNVMERDRTIGVCGCNTLTYDGSRQINCGVHMDILGYPYGRGRVFYMDAAIFIRRDIFEQIGGFDEKMFLYCEDRDLCWRVWLAGYKVVPVESAVFKHDSVCLVEGAAFNTNIRRRFMNEAFTLRMLLKNYSLFTLLAILPLYFLINVAEMLTFLLRGNSEFVLKTYLASYYWNLQNLKDTLRQRRVVQERRKVSDSKILAHLYKFSGKILLLKKTGLPGIANISKGINNNIDKREKNETYK